LKYPQFISFEIKHFAIDKLKLDQQACAWQDWWMLFAMESERSVDDKYTVSKCWRGGGYTPAKNEA
jgi:hypothetical protein